jgi:hypothetical protein
VRSIPRSRTNPQFNADALPGPLGDAGIHYQHLLALGGLRHRKKGRQLRSTLSDMSPLSGTMPTLRKTVPAQGQSRSRSGSLPDEKRASASQPRGGRICVVSESPAVALARYNLPNQHRRAT